MTNPYEIHATRKACDPLQETAVRDARSGKRELTSGRYRPEPDAVE